MRLDLEYHFDDHFSLFPFFIQYTLFGNPIAIYFYSFHLLAYNSTSIQAFGNTSHISSFACFSN